jgi:GT2 family glycosyltransferase
MNIETFITIVTYNSQDFILNCISSIIKSDYRKWFLTVVDNNSQDRTTDKIERLELESPHIDRNNFKLLKLGKNTGFAAAVNQAVFSLFKKDSIKGTQVEYLVLINPDTILEKDTLGNLVEVFASQESCIGTAGGLIFDYSKDKIQNAGGKIGENYVTAHLTSAEKDVYNVDYVSGALFITGVHLFRGLGGFDSGFRPLYFEELDYCLKLKKLGYSSIISRDAVARHYEGASVKKFSRNFYKYYHKNRIRCVVLNSAFKSFFRIFIPAEIKWLKNDATESQNSAIMLSYFLNFLFLPYNLIIRLKNYFLVRNYKGS